MILFSYLSLQIFMQLNHLNNVYKGTVQSLSRVWLFATPWTAARQASLSITNSRNLPRLMSIKSVVPSSHLLLCHPLLLMPLFFPSVRVFSNESALHYKGTYMHKIWELQLSNTIVFWGVEYQLILQTYKLYVYHSQLRVPIFLVCFFRSLFMPYYRVPSVSNCFTTTKVIWLLLILKNLLQYTIAKMSVVSPVPEWTAFIS